MKPTLLAPILILLLASCASPTRYMKKDSSGYGYEVVQDAKDPDLYKVEFVGNNRTPFSVVNNYSFLAANETCEAQKKLAIVGNGTDTTSTHFRSEYHYSSYRMGENAIPQLTPYTVATTIPSVSLPFTCFARLNQLQGVKEVRDIPADLAHTTAKDYKGAVVVEKLTDAAAGALRLGDLIVAVNDRRVESSYAYTRALSEAPGPSVKVRLFRNEKPLTVEAKLDDHTPLLTIANTELVKAVCERLAAEEKPEYCRR